MKTGGCLFCEVAISEENGGNDGCSVSNVYNLIASGELQAVRTGQRAGISVEEESFSTFLERKNDARIDIRDQT